MRLLDPEKREQFKNRTPHDPILEENNSSYITTGYFPKEELEKILPRAMSIPSDEVMAKLSG